MLFRAKNGAILGINQIARIASDFRVDVINKTIAKEEMLSSFIKFSSSKGSLKNNMVFSHFGQFSVALSF